MARSGELPRLPYSDWWALLVAITGLSGCFGMSAYGPVFEEEHSGNVTAPVNGSAILNCRVRHMTSRQVSWGRGIEVLTGGLMLFTSDRRFQPLHQTYSVDWGLRILSVRQADAGWYFCQISTSPPKTHYLYLSVVEPEVEILGGPDLYISQGSTANLTCVVRRAHRTPRHVRWTHDDKLIQFDRSRAGVKVHTWHEQDRTRTVSSLLIHRLVPTDTGEYFCDPDGLSTARVFLHVLHEEYPAAMQSGSRERGHQTASGLFALLCILCFQFIT